MTLKTQHTKNIKKIAKRLGFEFCGISKASFLEEEEPRLTDWLTNKHHGKMHYMENHFDKRLDPRKLVDGTKSVVSLMYNYYTEQKQEDKRAPKISKYAYGEDYHFVIKEKLAHFMAEIQSTIGEVAGRYFVDSAPVLEKAWAKKSGVGWLGKNTNIISPKSGSFFFLAELLLDLDLEEDGPIKDYCGTCTACIDACPTKAIEPYKVHGDKCISYFTIELKDQIDAQFKGTFDNWMFGCDVCQDVCPWNRFSKPHNEEKFMPKKELLTYSKKEWSELTKESFNMLFKKSAVKRTKYSGLMRNIAFLNSTIDT